MGSAIAVYNLPATAFNCSSANFSSISKSLPRRIEEKNEANLKKKIVKVYDKKKELYMGVATAIPSPRQL
jgi:hypothetical protein